MISSSCVRHTLGISPPLGETQTDDRAGSPCDLDHLGFKGLHMLQKGLHGLSCVDDGLREGKSKAWDGGRGGGDWWASQIVFEVLILQVRRIVSVQFRMYQSQHAWQWLHFNIGYFLKKIFNKLLQHTSFVEKLLWNQNARIYIWINKTSWRDVLCEMSEQTKGADHLKI